MFASISARMDLVFGFTSPMVSDSLVRWVICVHGGELAWSLHCTLVV